MRVSKRPPKEISKKLRPQRAAGKPSRICRKRRAPRLAKKELRLHERNGADQNRIVHKGIFFAFIFIVIGIFVLANTALLLFREAKLLDMGLVGFPSIIILGIAGFTFGWKKRKRQ